MINIIEKSKDFDKVDEYLMTKGKDTHSVKDVEDGTSIMVDGYIIFTDTKKDGTEIEVMSIITPEKEVYATQSQTFKESLLDIISIMGDGTAPIVKISGTTKAGRPYVDCKLDIERLR